MRSKECYRMFSSKCLLSYHVKFDHQKLYECRKSDLKFSQSSQLEIHIVAEHNVKKKNKCEICEHEFVFKWRLRKHLEDHSKTQVKTCHFFNNNKECPYKQIGCKFEHKRAMNCKFAQNCRVTKCQFRHE